MKEKITLDDLDIYKVSVEKRRFTEIDGKEYQIGPPVRRAYSNSEYDRSYLKSELSEPYLSAVLSVWGEIPTILPPDDE